MTGTPEQKKEQHSKVRLALAAMLAVLCAVLPASALSVNFSNSIGVVLSNVTNVILPDLLNLVIGSLPIIVVLAVVGFILTFLDKILSMIKY